VLSAIKLNKNKKIQNKKFDVFFCYSKSSSSISSSSSSDSSEPDWSLALSSSS